MRIAILGSGGREHAIAWKLAQDIDTSDIYSIPGNGGTPNNVNINISDFQAIKVFCEENRIQLIIVGPEAPLVAGIVDYFADSRIMVFGPSRGASRLEGSKIQAKEFMAKYDVQTADYTVFDGTNDPTETINLLDGNLVIKYDGLAAGKGVFVCSNINEAHYNIDLLKKNYGTSVRYLIEEKLYGQEISVIGFTDGESIKILLPSQDHKPIYDGDKGPNTGGMGAFCPVPFCGSSLLKKIEHAIIEPTLTGIQSEKLDYTGIIYFGLMIADDEPYLLEYNVRLGDPETEVILPAIESSLIDLILSCYEHSLNSLTLKFKPAYFVDVVIASGGYPDTYGKGYKITGLSSISRDCLVFHAGTRVNGNDIVTAGGRVLNIVATSNDLQSAIHKAYENVEKINFTNCYYRKDIGFKGLKP